MLAALPLVLASCSDSSDTSEAPPQELAGLETFGNQERAHVNGQVRYPQTPPVGGNHAAVWQDCGFYSRPIVTERGVHSLEHGAVWITYRPDLARDQVEDLRRLATSESHMLVSPWLDLPAPVVASAWGRQIRLESAFDPRLKEFVARFRLSPDAPEPGAACMGGSTATVAQ